jgi:hypothetical protein
MSTVIFSAAAAGSGAGFLAVGASKWRALKRWLGQPRDIEPNEP